MLLMPRLFVRLALLITSPRRNPASAVAFCRPRPPVRILSVVEAGGSVSRALDDVHIARFC